MKGLKFLIILFLGATLSPSASLAQYSELAARDNPQAQNRALITRLEHQEGRLLALEKELHALRAQVAQQARVTATVSPAPAAHPSNSPAPVSRPTVPNTGTHTYTVRSGDTLNSVARLHSVSVMELMAINDLRAPDRIQIGTELLIPTLQPSPPAPKVARAAPAPSPPAKSTAYTVRSGDTIVAIAKAHGITVQDIVAANGLPNANRIAIGQQLIITKPGTPVASSPSTVVATPKVLARTTIPASQPAAPPAAPAPTPEPTADNPFPSGYAYYTVVPKDNLYTLGKLFGTTQKELEELNGLKPNATIHPDQQLTVPMANYKGPFVSN